MRILIVMIITRGSCKYEIDFDLGKVYNLAFGGRRELTGTDNNGYVRCNINNKLTLIHRFIMENHLDRKLTEKEQVDHINGIKHDNRISNLRVVNTQENSQNRKGPIKNSQSGILGVRFITDGRNKPWLCRIANPETKKQYSKTFKTIEEAAEHRKNKEAEYNNLYGSKYNS